MNMVFVHHVALCKVRRTRSSQCGIAVESGITEALGNYDVFPKNAAFRLISADTTGAQCTAFLLI